MERQRKEGRKMTKIKQIARPIAEEFHRDKCCFEHTPADDFVKSQWQQRTKSVPYLIYRWIIGLLFIGVVIDTIIGSLDINFYLIYLTNWGIILCMLTNVLGAVLVTIYHFHPKFQNKLLNLDSLISPFKVYWGLHQTTLTLSIVITVMFWTVIYNPATVKVDLINVLTHICNAVFMLLDLLIVAYPIRLLHIYLPIGLGVIYACFSVIYYLAGGLDPKGKHFIYETLDWQKPGPTMVLVIGVLVLTCFVHLVVYMIFRVRVTIHRRMFAAPLTFTPTVVDGMAKDLEKTGVLHSPSGISMVLGNYTSYDNHAFSTVSERVERQI